MMPGDKQREGHAQKQGVKITTHGEKRGKDALERGHDEGGVDGYWVGKVVGASSNVNFAV